MWIFSTTALVFLESFTSNNRSSEVPESSVHIPVCNDCCWSWRAQPSCLELDQVHRHNLYCRTELCDHAEAWTYLKLHTFLVSSSLDYLLPLLQFFFPWTWCLINHLHESPFLRFYSKKFKLQYFTSFFPTLNNINWYNEDWVTNMCYNF